jgi:uncharacterized membrane protein
MKKDLLLIYGAVIFLGLLFGVGIVYVMTEDALLTAAIAFILVVGDMIAFTILKRKMQGIKVEGVEKAEPKPVQKQTQEM